MVARRYGERDLGLRVCVCIYIYIYIYIYSLKTDVYASFSKKRRMLAYRGEDGPTAASKDSKNPGD